MKTTDRQGPHGLHFGMGVLAVVQGWLLSYFYGPSHNLCEEPQTVKVFVVFTYTWGGLGDNLGGVIRSNLLLK